MNSDAVPIERRSFGASTRQIDKSKRQSSTVRGQPSSAPLRNDDHLAGEGSPQQHRRGYSDLQLVQLTSHPKVRTFDTMSNRYIALVQMSAAPNFRIWPKTFLPPPQQRAIHGHDTNFSRTDVATTRPWSVSRSAPLRQHIAAAAAPHRRSVAAPSQTLTVLVRPVWYESRAILPQHMS